MSSELLLGIEIKGGRSPSTLTRRFAAPSPRGRGIAFKIVLLPLGEGGPHERSECKPDRAQQSINARMRVEGLLPSFLPFQNDPLRSASVFNGSCRSCG